MSKVLVVLSRFPYPLDKGDKLRAYHQIKLLSQTHEVYLFCLTHHNIPQSHKNHLSLFCKQIKIYKISVFPSFIYLILNLIRFQPLQCALFYSIFAKCSYNRFLRQVSPNHVFTQLLRMSAYTKSWKGPKSLDLQDAFSRSTFKRYQRTSWYLRLPLWYEYKALKRAENQSQYQYPTVFIISERDKSYINFANPSQLKVLPNGIDLAYFAQKSLSFSKEYDFIFSGNMSYPPNEDAALYLIQEIFPLVKVQIPQAKLLIAGTSPRSYLRSKQSADIIISGWLPDIRDAYQSSRIFVAPLRMGGGMQNKVLEAMAMGLPCICPTLVTEGIQAENLPTLPLLNAESSPLEFAKQMVDLYKNQELQNRLSQEGIDYVRNYFDWNLPIYKLQNYI